MTSLHLDVRDEFFDTLSSIIRSPKAVPGNKPWLSYKQAGLQISRGDMTWNGIHVAGKPVSLVYAFQNWTPSNMPDNISGFKSLNTGQRDAIRKALGSWADVARVSFKEKSWCSNSDAQLKFGGFTKSTDESYAFSFFPKPSGGPHSGEAWFNTNSSSISKKFTLYGYGRETFVHEIGHTLGLYHPSDYNAGAGKALTYANNAKYAQDTIGYSVMSYFSERYTGQDFFGYYPSAPMLHDISAIQHLYGANMYTRKGDTTYGFHSNADREYFKASTGTDVLIFSVWDAGGYNTFDFSGYKQAQKIDLHQGAFSNVGGLKGNVSIAMGTHIQHAIGGLGNDLIIGNNDKNLLEGTRGNNTFVGGPGGDVFIGGPGRNTYCYTHVKDSPLRDPDLIKDFKGGRDKLDFSALKGAGVAKVMTKIEHLHRERIDKVFVTVDGHKHPDMQIKIMGHIDDHDILYGKLQHGLDHVI